MPTGQADNTIAFTFEGKRNIPSNDSLEAAIVAEGINIDGSPVEKAAPAAVAAPKPAEPGIAAASKPAEPAIDAKAADTLAAPKPDDALKTYKILVDGVEMEVTEADLKAGHMRHRDYTQKTQKLSAYQKELEARQQTWENEIAQRDEALHALDQFLKDPTAIQSYIAKAFGAAAPAAPVVDPNKPITVEDVANIARYNAEQVRLSLQRDTRTEVEEAKRTAREALNQLEATRREKVENEVDRHLASVLDKFPMLRELSENIEEELMGDASRYLPQGSSLADAKTRLTEAAERRAASIAAITEKAKKAAAISAAELRKNSAEPAGGSAPKPAAGKKLTLETRDRQARLAAAMADVEAFMGGQLP